MATTIVHFNNARRYRRPVLVWCGGCQELQPVEPTGTDAFGPFYEIEVESEQFEFTFRDGVLGDPDMSALQRSFAPPPEANAPVEIWCQSGNPFVYQVCPRQPDRRHASEYLRTLRFKEGVYVPGSGGLSGLGATVLAEAGVLFGLYHPTAARVYVMGDFNDWNGPDGDPEKVVELRRYRGWFNTANTWLTVVDKAKAGDEYQFVVVGGVPSNGGTSTLEVTDPYARVLGETRSGLCAAVVDPTEYEWRDEGWQTPLPSDLIVYELSVYGLTAGLDDLPDRRKGRFSGVVELMKDGYFEDLGINLLALMPITEVPSQQGPESLGYNPILPMTVERDLGTPEGLRAMVDAAHGHGLAIILDKVFNHTSNRANLLWQTVLEHPDEEARNEGGLYFAGETPWGNRTALHKEDVQNLFIDACKMWLQEYHVDGFRFDATSTMYMDHGFVIRLARELQAFRPGVILVAENLPNESDLNLEGYNGIMQWSCLFHHKMKALLREGQYLDWHA
ncbi:MAG: 1,4-alpha-glucan branching protein, partial [Armatimonadetes bacterium]|nr:1,4-alpha-glucan branching protein [Armatimonadota bacterium]